MKKIKHRICFLVLKMKEEECAFVARKTYHIEVMTNSTLFNLII